MKHEQLLEKIRQEALMFSEPFPSREYVALPPLPDPENFKPDSLSHLTDEEYITEIYKIVLNREPDPTGFDYYRFRLKTGRLNRKEVFYFLAASDEARSKGIAIKGLKWKILWIKAKSIPLRIWMKPVETVLLALDEQSKAIDKLGQAVESSKLSMDDLLQRQDLLAEKSREDHARIEKLSRECFLLSQEMNRRRISWKENFDEIDQHQGEEMQHKEKELSYASFEDRFRGYPWEVEKNLEVYLPLLSDIRGEILDLGSGRGEWLKLLQDNNFNARGIDSNSVLVEECHEKGLNCAKADVFDFLNSCQQDIYAAVSAFHLVEHILPQDRISFLEAIYRVLAPQGLLIMETPNVRNLLVGASEFYRDPTHLFPFFPDTAAFLAERVGFEDVRIFFFDDARSRFIPAEEIRFNTLEDYIRVSRDYALIGRKPA